MAANVPTFSQQYAWVPAAAEFILDAYSRIQIRGREITPEHLIEARRSANLLLGDWSNLGVNLWKIGDPDVGLALTQPYAGLPPTGLSMVSQPAYPLPIDTADLLDSYLRTFTPAATGTNIGAALAPVTDFMGNPIINAPYGDVQLASPTSGTLSTMAGSQYINVYWPSHGLAPLYPIFWGMPVWVGGVLLPVFSIVSRVVDSNNVVIMAPARAVVTAQNQGLPPLFQTQSGSATVNVFMPGHGLRVGYQFNIGIPTTLGGLTLSGLYAVTSLIANPYGQASHEFTITAAHAATSNAAAFENGGQIAVTQQVLGQAPTDVFMWPVSRNDFAMLPIKDNPGNQTSYWFNRTIIPELRVWPIPPVGSTPGSGPFLGFVGYRSKDIQVLNPGMGQNVDIPRRFYEPFVAGVCAKVAEKFRPAQFMAKLALAKAAWDTAADNDREKVMTRVQPEMGAYFN